MLIVINIKILRNILAISSTLKLCFDKTRTEIINSCLSILNFFFLIYGLTCIILFLLMFYTENN